VHDPGDQLLFALSAWGDAPRPRYARAFDELFLNTATAELQGDVALERWRALATLAALGHVEQVTNGSDHVLVGPAVLVRLPAAGVARALLCGRRAPSALNALRGAARSTGRVQLEVQSQTCTNRYAPARIEISATEEAVVEDFARHLGVRYIPVPPAWSLAEFSGSLGQRVEGLQWLDEPDLDWVRHDFSPKHLRFISPRVAEASGDLRLSRYTNPTTNSSTVRLWKGGKWAEIDRSFGRFEVLRVAGRRVLSYDERRFVFREAWGAPLPPLLARALTLCTGEVARGNPETGELRGHNDYAGVPPDIAQTVLEKMGQAEL
jgi:hypothetical protein